jgi:hypothetical protein
MVGYSQNGCDRSGAIVKSETTVHRRARLPVPVEIGPNVRTFRAARLAREQHDPEGDRFSLATNAKRVCAEIMLKQSNKIMMRFHLIAS